MQLKVKLESKQNEPREGLFGRSARTTGLCPGPLSGAGSVAIHLAVIFLLVLGSQAVPPPPVTYQLRMLPLQSGKLIWYQPSERLPEVSSPDQPPGTKPKITTVRPGQTISVNSPEAKDGRQYIWQPPPKITVQNEVRSPNILAFAPAPARPVRAFVAPQEARPPANRPTALLPEATPVLSAPSVPDPLPITAALPGPSKPPAREFVPPPSKAGAAPSTSAALETAPELPAAGDRPQASLAVIGLNPARVPDIPLPEGSRPARFSAGPVAGGNGAEHAANIVVPGVNISGNPAASTSTVVEPSRKAQPYREPTVQEWAKTATGRDSRRMARLMMSAALQPSARVLAATVEQQFRGRAVYTTSFAVGADGGAEWIIWFAPKNDNPGAYASVRPPVPWDRRAPESNSRFAGGSVQIAAIVQPDGSLASATVVKSSDPSVGAAALQFVAEWDFLPALRNGEPVAADVLIDIRFHP